MLRLVFAVSLVALALTALPRSADADASNLIEWAPSVSLKVGQQKVIHGIRGETCGTLPGKNRLKTRFLKTGQIVYGKPGVRNSRSCGGMTPAVEVIFIATTPGKETITVSGDKIRVTVTE